MNVLKPLTPALINAEIKRHGYPKTQFTSELVQTIARLTIEQIKDRKGLAQIADELALTVANRLPKGFESILLARGLSDRFLKLNSSD